MGQYIPTPQEIADECEKIRAEWTPFIEGNRRGMKNPPARIPGAELEPEWTDVGATRESMRRKLGSKPSWGAEHKIKQAAMEGME